LYCFLELGVRALLNALASSVCFALGRYEGAAGLGPGGLPPIHAKPAGQGSASGGLAALLAPCYSINGAMPAFEHADAAATQTSGDTTRTVRACYGLSVALLGCYVYAAWWRCPDKVAVLEDHAFVQTANEPARDAIAEKETLEIVATAIACTCTLIFN
jgi:hypothetical protein